jgi:hypothetical protein
VREAKGDTPAYCSNPNPPTCSRPREVSQVAYQEEVVSTLEQALKSNNVRPPCPLRDKSRLKDRCLERRGYAQSVGATY